MFSDRRGSILLPGMAMGMILTMIGIHMVDTAKGALTRELGQNFVDAVALESAVWHAQGMNLLAFINIVMAAVLAVLVAIRVAEILLIGAIAILTIAAAVASFFSFGTGGASLTPLIEMLSNALSKVIQLENRVSPKIIKTLEKAQDIERAVAAVMPYVAIAHPVTTVNGIGGIPFQFSIVPAIFEQQFSLANITWEKKSGSMIDYKVETAFPARMGTFVADKAMLTYNASTGKLIAKAKTKVPAGGGSRIDSALEITKWGVGSLPAQEEDFYQLCGRAAELVVANLLKVFTFGAMDDKAIAKVSSFAAVIAGSLQTVACTPISSLKSTVESQVNDAVDTKCKENKKKKEDGGDTWTDGDQTTCVDEQKKAYQKQFATPDPSDIKVARLWGIIAAPKESPFLHVYANSGIESPLNVEGANANAEFRHVCDGNNDAAWRGCGENSMWSNGWFARLVPVRDFGTEVQAKLGEVFAGWASRFLGKNIVSVFDVLLKKVNTNPLASGPLRDALNRLFGNLIGPKAANGWWNRRLAAGRPFQKLQQWGLTNDLNKYPEYLH